MATDNTNGNSEGNNSRPTSTAGQVSNDVRQNVSDTSAAVSKATSAAVSKAGSALQGLVSGEANIVDAAVAVKGAFDSVTGLSGKISASVMMPAMKADACDESVGIL